MRRPWSAKRHVTGSERERERERETHGKGAQALVREGADAVVELLRGTGARTPRSLSFPLPLCRSPCLSFAVSVYLSCLVQFLPPSLPSPSRSLPPAPSPALPPSLSTSLCDREKRGSWEAPLPPPPSLSHASARSHPSSLSPRSLSVSLPPSVVLSPPPPADGAAPTCTPAARSGSGPSIVLTCVPGATPARACPLLVALLREFEFKRERSSCPYLFTVLRGDAGTARRRRSENARTVPRRDADSEDGSGLRTEPASPTGAAYAQSLRHRWARLTHKACVTDGRGLRTSLLLHADGSGLGKCWGLGLHADRERSRAGPGRTILAL